MATFYPTFTHPYKNFQRYLASLNGYFGVRDRDNPSKQADADIHIAYTLSGTAVEGVDYDIITDSGNWATAPAVSSPFIIHSGDAGGSMFVRILNPTAVKKPLSIVIQFTSITQGNAVLRSSDVELRAVAYIEPSNEWVNPISFTHLGNFDGSGQGPTLGETDIALFPNWGRSDVELLLDIPVSGIRSDGQTEQRLSTFAYDPVTVDPGDPEFEAVLQKGDMNLQMTVVYTATRDRNFDAYHILAAAQQKGICWVPFYPQPLYPLSTYWGYNPIHAANSRVSLYEGKEQDTRGLLVLGRKLIRVNAADTTSYEISRVQNEPEEIWSGEKFGLFMLETPWALSIGSRIDREISFVMLPMIMLGPLERPSDTDDVHHMRVTWELLDL